MGAMDSGSADIVVQRDVLGLLRQRRTVYSGYAWGPSMQWLDSSTIVLDDQRVDIFHGGVVEEAD